MKNFTTVSTVHPLSFDELRRVVGGDGDVLTPDGLLLLNGVVVEDFIDL